MPSSISPTIKTISRISQNQWIGNVGGNLDDIAAQFDAAPLSGTVNPGFRGACHRARIRATRWLDPATCWLIGSETRRGAKNDSWPPLPPPPMQPQPLIRIFADP